MYSKEQSRNAKTNRQNSHTLKTFTFLLIAGIKNKNKPLILFVMKTTLHYSNVKPMPKQKTNIDILFWFAYGSFCLMVLGMAFGMDLLKLWLK